MKTYAELFNLYKKKFNKKDESALKFIFFETLLENSLDYYKNNFKTIDKKIEKVLEYRVNRLIKGEPPQYIIGHAYFFGYKIKVNKDVLIPRFDTEILVDRIIKDYKNNKISIADIGTGSGCIAIALKKQLPNARVVATDLSLKALNIAKQNFKNNKVKIKTVKGNLLKPILEKKVKFDVIVSNPPYIAFKDDEIENQVKTYEPKIALYSLEKGLNHIKQIIKDGLAAIKPTGSIYLEIGHKQAKDVKAFIKQTYQSRVLIEIIKDINGKNRVVKIKFK